MPIQKQPEPPHFYETVQKKGEEFRLKYPDKELEPYWRKIIPDLHEAYCGICAYTCHCIPLDTGSPTVDHFKPKGKYPQYAYHWDNYRLACGIINSRKREFEDVLDPFTLQDSWFEMPFPSVLLRPREHLTSTEKEQVEKTIKRLKLNEYPCKHGRESRLKPYLQGKYDFEHLAEMAPFLARELKRQKLDDVNHPMWAGYREQ